ncbi:MAG TPA: hypothetical protein VJ343_00930 [archaeon]|nr:hypothetical protein [archaeon]
MISDGESKLLAREILIKMKGDERVFDDFVRFLERNKERREIFLFVLKRILIDESMKMYSKA